MPVLLFNTTTKANICTIYVRLKHGDLSKTGYKLTYKIYLKIKNKSIYLSNIKLFRGIKGLT